MKSYKDMADNVFSRIEEEKEIERKKRHSRNHMAASLAVFGLALLIGAGVWIGGQVTIGGPGPQQDSETESQTELPIEKKVNVTYKEVVFANYDTRLRTEAKTSSNHIIVIEKYSEDEDALYACYVRQIGESLQTAEVVQTMLDKGLMVVQSYPYCMYNRTRTYTTDGEDWLEGKYIVGDCVVVGTYQQLMDVFGKISQGINGAYFRVANAPRPDLVDAIYQYSTTIHVSDIVGTEDSVVRFSYELPEVLGSNYCEGTMALETYEEVTGECDYTIVNKEVTFFNSYGGQIVDFYVITKNTIWSSYLSDDKEALYAFCAYGYGNIAIEGQKEGESDIDYNVRHQLARSQRVAEKALEMGLMVLPDYVFCGYNNDNLEAIYSESGALIDRPPLYGDCVIVGTLQQINWLLKETEPVDGTPWQLFGAVRPDWLNIIKQVGLTNRELEMAYEGGQPKKELFEAITGTEKYVTLTVPVMVPKKTE